MPDPKLYISKVHLPDGNDYELKDSEARDLIETLSHIGLSFVRSTDAASTPLGVTWTDGSAVITGTLAPSAEIKNIYLVPDNDIPGGQEGESHYIEYVCVIIGESGGVKTFAWEAIGSTDARLDDLGDMAKANTATGSTTLSTVNTAAYENGTASVSATYTPAGSVSVSLSQTDTAATLTKGDYTPAGTINVTLAQTSTAASLTKADYTPEGTVSKPSITVTPATVDIQSKKTDGSVTAGSAASFTEGAFTQGSFTQGTDQWTAPVLTTSVSGETLTIGFSAGSFQQGTDSYTSASKAADTFVANVPTSVSLPTFEKISPLSSVSAELAAAPVFTGTKADNALVTGVAYDKASVDAHTFTGTTAENVLVTAVNYDKAGVQSAGFTGTEATINSTGTSAGDVTLAKSDKTITIQVSPDSRA